MNCLNADASNMLSDFAYTCSKPGGGAVVIRTCYLTQKPVMVSEEL